MSKPCKPKRPNAVGESPMLIRWIVEMDNGWIGSWDEAPLAEYCDLKRQLAEARVALNAAESDRRIVERMTDELEAARLALKDVTPGLNMYYPAWAERHATALKAARGT